MESSAILSIYLVRHGLTKWNVEQRYLGRTDVSLLENNKKELIDLKDRLKAIQFDNVYCSDLTRCKETLAHLNPHGQAQFDDRLREMDFGDWEGATYDQLKDNTAYSYWLDNWLSLAPPNGESGTEFCKRIDSFMTELQKVTKSNKILIVSHGGVIRYILSKLVPERTFWEWNIKHGKAIRMLLTWQKEEWKCSSWSEVPMPENEA